MNDADIIKAEELLKKLEEAYNAYYDTSKSMPYDIDTTIRETAICLENAIEKIKLQKAEIERLVQEKDNLIKTYKECMTEAITEFERRLVSCGVKSIEVGHFDNKSYEFITIRKDRFDQTAKVMKEGVDNA